MAKVQLGARIPPELLEKIEEEADDGYLSKADIVTEALTARYAGTSAGTSSHKTKINSDDNEFVAYLKEHVAYLKEENHRKSDIINELMRVNNSLIEKLLQKKSLEQNDENF
jgi:hypothetical protein